MVLQHGKFDEIDTIVTSRALAGFSVGLVGFSVYLFVLRGFYAHGDAKTPFVINLFETRSTSCSRSCSSGTTACSVSASHSRSPTSSPRCGRCR
jgi:hypothetical protein